MAWDWEANRYLVSADGVLVELDEVFGGTVKAYVNGGVTCFDERSLKRLIKSGELKSVTAKEFDEVCKR